MTSRARLPRSPAQPASTSSYLPRSAPDVRLSLLRRPEVAVGDLDQIACRVVEVKRSAAGVPFVLVRDLDATPGQSFPRLLIALTGRDQTGMAGPGRPVVGDRTLALREPRAVEQQHLRGPDSERQPVGPASHQRQAQELAVEALDRLALAGLVVERGLEHALEPRLRRGHRELRGPPGGISSSARSRFASPPPAVRLRRRAR